MRATCARSARIPPWRGVCVVGCLGRYLGEYLWGGGVPGDGRHPLSSSSSNNGDVVVVGKKRATQATQAPESKPKATPPPPSRRARRSPGQPPHPLGRVRREEGQKKVRSGGGGRLAPQHFLLEPRLKDNWVAMNPPLGWRWKLRVGQGCLWVHPPTPRTPRISPRKGSRLSNPSTLTLSHNLRP